MATAKQPHPAILLLTAPPHYTAAKQPHPHYTAQSAKQLTALGHNQTKEARLHSNTAAKQLEPLAKKAASTCL